MTENKGDLISRSALRKNMEFICMGIMAGTEPYNAPLTEIDNAPTVCGNNPKWCESCVSKGKCASTSKDRTQGEWIKWNFKTFGALGDWEYKCSNCEKVYDGAYNFCPNCGADMRREVYEE